MKKATLFLSMIFVLFAFAACGNNQKTPEPSSTTYTITWVDENGKTLKSQTVNEGEVPAYSYNVQDSAEWDYTFIGWATAANGEALSNIPAANSDTTYYALVSAVKQVYTVKFNTLGGSEVAPQTVEYGGKVSVPEMPKYDGHRFVGWSKSENEVVEADFETPVTENVEYFAVWNEVVDVKALLSALLNGYQLNPYKYIPESMKIDYNANLINAEDVIIDYSSFVNISDITYGFGEQWYMVLENINQSMRFFNVLSVIETLSASSITAFNNYFDQNPADTAHYEFENGIYNIAIKFDGEILLYVVDFTTTLPAFGEVTAQIALAMSVESGEKTVRVQLGDANALAYTVSENCYEFAVMYLNARTAMFHIEQNDDGSVIGKIYEHIAVNDTDLLSSAANFYITDDYISVVGNKADGIIGFSNTICELYDAESGKMIGYEIKETREISGVNVNFDTLWFNLNSISGLNSVKYVPASDDTEASIYVNGSNTAWKYKTVGGFSLTTFSRRFDIEFRTQYVVSYDSSTSEYTVHKIQVPMLFVQEEYYDTLSADIKSVNNNLTTQSTVKSADLDKLLSDYELLIPVFTEEKSAFTKEIIKSYIGEKITFE